MFSTFTVEIENNSLVADIVVNVKTIGTCGPVNGMTLRDGVIALVKGLAQQYWTAGYLQRNDGFNIIDGLSEADMKRELRYARIEKFGTVTGIYVDVTEVISEDRPFDVVCCSEEVEHPTKGGQ